MARIAALIGLLLAANAPAQAEPNFEVWRVAHEQLLAKWRCAEPRCGWTVGGYTCSSRTRARGIHTRAR